MDLFYKLLLAFSPVCRQAGYPLSPFKVILLASQKSVIIELRKLHESGSQAILSSFNFSL